MMESIIDYCMYHPVITFGLIIPIFFGIWSTLKED